MAQEKLVLVVEDDDSVRTLLTRALQAHYRVEAVANGRAALLRLQQDPTPDLLICDIMMPGVDGLDVAREAKCNPKLSRVPIIFLTARSTPRDVIRGIQAGARHYVTKPFQLDALMDKVRRTLDSRK